MVVYLRGEEAVVAQTVTLVTAEDLEKLPSDVRCELIDGVLIEMPPANLEHGYTESNAGTLLSNHVRANRLGWVLTGDPGFILRRNPDTVRAPDVAFIRAGRFPAGRLPRRGFAEIAPDLVVEVISPSDTPAEVQAKVRDWIEAGVRMVWLMYPEQRTVHVIRSLQERLILDDSAVLDGGDMVPGFSCRVAELFD